MLFSLCFACTEDNLPGSDSSTYEPRYETVLSSVLSSTCKSYAEQSRAMRGVFAEMEIPELSVIAAHTHGRSAAKRSSSSAFADFLGARTGRTPVFIQGSRSDQEKGRENTRHFRWGKDTNAEPSFRPADENDLTVMVDVDYYIDMNQHLGTHAKPLLMYTFQPSQSARNVGEYKYTFNADHTVTYHVSGGGEYRHKVWNWRGDSVCATTTYMGVMTSYTVFALERRQVDEDHQLVLLTPIRTWGMFWCWFAKTRAKAEPVRHLNPLDNGFVRLQQDRSDGLYVSTARVGGFLSATVKAEIDEAVGIVAATQKAFTHASVKAKMSGSEGSGDTSGSEILYAFYHSKADTMARLLQTTGDKVCSVNHVRSYQYVKSLELYEPGQPSMVSFMQPIMDGAFAPERHWNNDDRTVRKRVTDLQREKQKRDHEHVSPFLRTCMEEFCRQVEGHVGRKLHPVDYDTVYENQQRPTQRRILDEAQHTLDDGTATAMQKAEAYGNMNDPRNITIMNPASKLEHSRWLYAVYDALKELPWYAFGKVPCEIATHMATLCSSAEWWADMDCSRMDGRVDTRPRLLEEMVMLRLFHPSYHTEILRNLKTQTHLRVRTRFGVTYNSGNTRASGSAQTSAFNTLLSAFIAYLAFRMSRKPNGAFYAPNEAYSRLGLYGGDDGGTPDLDKKSAEKAAAMMGQKLEIIVIKRGEPGVQFLARYYGPNVWYGDPNSCCDISRQLLKFHATTHLNGVSENQKLLEKCFAFSLSDSATPVVGPFVTKALQIAGFTRRDYSNVLNIWNSQLEQEVHYPNEYEDWMDSLLESQNPEFDATRFMEWLDSCFDLYALRSCPLFMPRVEAVARSGQAVVDGEVHNGPAEILDVSETASQRGSTTERSSSRTRRRRQPSTARSESTAETAPSSQQRGRRAGVARNPHGRAERPQQNNSRSKRRNARNDESDRL